MGCDGGTIPRRDELVRLKKKPEAKDKESELIFLWRCCAITQQLLKLPIVMCGLGKLYSKEAVIEGLLNKETLPEFASHIKNLKDLKELNLTPNSSHKPKDTHEESLNVGSAPYICPIIGLEMSGKFRFVALWSCGCVFSERALKTIESKICLQCQKPFETDDVVILNGNEEDLVLMNQRMIIRQQKQKKNKGKKIKTEVDGTETVKEEKFEKEMVINKASTSGTSSGIKRAGKLDKEQIDTKKMKADYSVAKDPKATDVYKSLFTTHKSEKEQVRAHWVTYNPFYN